MRRLENKKSAAKRQKRNRTIMGVVLIVVMFGSVFGIITTGFSSNSNQGNNGIDYNGYTFTNSNGYWVLNIGELEYSFLSNPLEIENFVDLEINGTLNSLGSYYGSPVYVSSENSGAEAEIYRNIGQVAERFQRACLNGENCAENLPIRDCSNNFIIIKQGNESKITQENNCVFIEGESNNLVRITDDFLLRIIGIK